MLTLFTWLIYAVLALNLRNAPLIYCEQNIVADKIAALGHSVGIRMHKICPPSFLLLIAGWSKPCEVRNLSFYNISDFIFYSIDMQIQLRIVKCALWLCTCKEVTKIYPLLYSQNETGFAELAFDQQNDYCETFWRIYISRSIWYWMELRTALM